MEVDPPNPERISSEQEGPIQTQQARSYECTFCKRGFSNAQALGGHMNIHRRDRAKLKEPSITTNKKDPASSPPPLLPMISTEPGSLELDSSEDKGSSPRQPRPITREFRQLQLFAERPSSRQGHKSGSCDTSTDGSSPPADNELDLELRLGHES